MISNACALRSAILLARDRHNNLQSSKMPQPIRTRSYPRYKRASQPERLGGMRTLIIAVLIISLLLWLLALDAELWEALKNALRSALEYLTKDLGIPQWVMWATLVTTVISFWLIYHWVNDLKGPSFLDYKEDLFHGMVWRWRFNTSGNGILEPECFCIHDGTPLMHHNSHSDVTYTCDLCGNRYGPLHGTHHSISRDVQSQVEQKIRDGEWKSVLKVEKL